MKIFSFEILASILDYFGNFFLFYRDFIVEIKDLLCETVLKNCLHQEKQFFVLAYKIFIILVMNYRHFLKDEIQVLMEQIFLKILTSGNSSFSHRFYSLQVVFRFFSNYQILIEFFLNYDCEMNQTNLVEKLFEMLSKISQGKYIKDVNILQPSQEISLRMLALESMGRFLKELGKGLEVEGFYSKPLSQQKIKDPIQNNEEFEGPQASMDFLSDLVTTNDTDNFEKSRALKQEIMKAIVKFNNKPDHGVKHLISIGFLSTNE